LLILQNTVVNILHGKLKISLKNTLDFQLILFTLCF